MNRLCALSAPFAAALGLLVSSATALHAQFEFGANSSPASSVSFVAEVSAIAPGEPFEVALSLEHPEGWHSYYKNSGGVELPLSIEWNLPDGFSAGPIQWPVPSVKDGFFGKSFIYEGNPVFLVAITPPQGLEADTTATLRADAAWQICEDACINEEKSVTLTLPVAAEAVPDPAVAALFATARAALPGRPGNWSFSATADGADFLLRVTPDAPFDGDPVDFVPDQPFVKSASSGGAIIREGDSWLLRLPRALTDAFDDEIPQGHSFSGVLIGPRPVAVPETVIGEGSGGDTATVALPAGRYLGILGGMLLGGLILNLMPCVFPVIGLKIMGFVQQAGSERGKIVLHGLTFTVGVLASFGVLSAILFALRSAAASGGDAVGWGYQLQNPWVVLGLMLLMFLLALNMFGVFEIGASAGGVGGSLQAKQGLAGSFFSGVLATVVATPCSAPFLGAAIGIAVTLPAAQFFAAFGAMALGLALPYLVLSVFPNLIAFLPRPGPWMESFKQAMSFLLFATAGYLLWVYAGLIDADNLLGPIFGLSSIAVACWIHGRWNLPHRSSRARLVAIVLTVLFAASGLFLAKPPKPSALDWQPWSLETQRQLLEEGRPVYIDFTAKWCATCQLNKRRAYNSDVVKAMRERNVATLVADKTRPNPEIDRALAGYGRTAIPVNVLLAPEKDPVILPELLAPADILRALDSL